jgi:hypothetical protein
MMSDYHVKMEEDSLTAFHVLFKGPKESASASVFPWKPHFRESSSVVFRGYTQ